MPQFATRRARSLEELSWEHHFPPRLAAKCLEYLAGGSPGELSPFKCVWYIVFYAENMLHMATSSNSIPGEEKKRAVEVWENVKRMYREYLWAYNRGLLELAQKKAVRLYRYITQNGIDPF